MSEEEIYKKLKLIRKERGLTLNNLADKIGADYQQISRIERGKSKLTIDVLMKMADALDTPIGDLVKDQHEIKEAPKPLGLGVESKKQTPQELLGLILEKIETTLQNTKKTLHPQTKAALATQIYTQAHQLKSEGISTEDFIDFSIGIIKTLQTP